jgi:predicted transposase YbfD/YdcC
VAECIVTVDAMGAQTKIAETIRDEKADYVLRVKDNKGQLLQDIQDWFSYADQIQFANMAHSYAQTVNKGHGRIESRRCWAIDDPLTFEYIRHDQGWRDLQTILRVQRERRLTDKTKMETAFYISSLAADAELLLSASATIGQLKTVCIGCWKSFFERAMHGFVSATPPRTWRSCDSWRSIFSKRHIQGQHSHQTLQICFRHLILGEIARACYAL